MCNQGLIDCYIIGIWLTVIAALLGSQSSKNGQQNTEMMVGPINLTKNPRLLHILNMYAEQEDWRLPHFYFYYGPANWECRDEIDVFINAGIIEVNLTDEVVVEKYRNTISTILRKTRFKYHHDMGPRQSLVALLGRIMNKYKDSDSALHEIRETIIDLENVRFRSIVTLCLHNDQELLHFFTSDNKTFKPVGLRLLTEFRDDGRCDCVDRNRGRFTRQVREELLKSQRPWS